MGLRIVEEAGLSDVGRQRSTNEDAYFMRAPLFAVSDGMGGAQAGEVASQLAIDAVGDIDLDTSAPEAALEQLAKEANRRIYDMAQSDERRAGMGCTLTTALLRDAELTFGHVGDSRAYRLRDGTLEQLTSDHSLVEELRRQGKLTAEEAEVHPQRSIITRALGPEADVEVDKLTYPARDGDVYLLCSDGLTGMVADGKIAELLGSSASLDEASRLLVEAANDNGGRDNITVVLFRVGADGEADAPDDEDTNVDLHVEDVRREMTRQAAVPQQTRPTSVQETRASPTRETRSGGPSAVADRARLRDDEVGAQPSRPPPGRGSAASRPPARRRGLALALVLVLAGALAAGLYVGSRQFYFVGTDDNGLVTLYRGVPYELPLGLDLYEAQYKSSVPASSIKGERRRERILDHRLRERGDAVDLVRELERQRTGL